MNHRLSGVQRRWFALYLLFVGAVPAAHNLRNRRDPWSIGEWLINYSGGFVRRGLPGEMFLGLMRLTGSTSYLWVCALQILVYCVFLVAVYRLAVGLRWSYALTALLLSPATTGFMILNFDQSMRKEILLFAGLAVVCLPWFSRLADWQAIAWLSVAAPAVVLSHESAVLYMPYLFAAVALQRGGLRQAVRLLALPALAAGAAAIEVAWHPGHLATAQSICASLGATLEPFGSASKNICSGSISWLQMSFSSAHAYTMQWVHDNGYFRLYIPLSLLALLPAVLVLTALYRRGHLRREVALIAGCAACSLAASLLLFYGGVDWGRWISMHVVCLMLLILTVSRRTAVPDAAEEPRPEARRPARVAATLAVVLYATCWALPATGEGPSITGYIGLSHRLRAHMAAKGPVPGPTAGTPSTAPAP
jgi:hypothetical protein